MNLASCPSVKLGYIQRYQIMKYFRPITLPYDKTETVEGEVLLFLLKVIRHSRVYGTVEMWNAFPLKCLWET